MSSDVNLADQQPTRASAKHGKGSTGGKPKDASPEQKTGDKCPWKIGQRVEACDSHGNWYPAKILNIENFKLLIHFQRWSSRFDEWFDMDSDLVRLTEESNKNNNMVPFNVNDEVLARWSDSKLYPARIIKLFNDNVSCHVLFYDGYKKKVKLSAIERMPSEYAGDLLPPNLLPKPFVAPDPTNHNEFICDICKKGFRKETLLTSHKKHYHNIVDGSPNQEAQAAAVPSDLQEVEIKEDSKVEVEKSDIIVKVENTSEDEAKDVIKEIPPEASLNDSTKIVGKKRKNKEGGGAKKLSDSSFVTPKRPKIQSTVYPPTTNPYSYYYESTKSLKKSKPNLTLPFSIQNAQLIADAHDNDNIDEIVKCTCTLREENGLMVQCELCLSWQHALCMGFTQESDVPADGYFCPFCRSPPKACKSQKNSYQLNHWLKNALDPVFSPSHFVPIVTGNASAHSEMVNWNGIQTNHCVKLEHESSVNTFEVPHPLMNSADATIFDSYFPNAKAHSSFANVPTITTTTTAANNGTIASVSECNKGSSLSLGSFTNGSNSLKVANDFDMPPSAGLFSSGFLDDDEPKDVKKTFALHDFTNHANHNTDLNIEDDHIDSLIDMNLKNGFYDEPKLVDEDEAFANQVKATNILSSALLDIMNNLHSLNYKIVHHKDVASAQILEKQAKLRENMKLIEAKLEKIEKEIELKDSYAIHTSSSTLTATSPENFGFSDINHGINGSFSSSQPTTSFKQPITPNIFDSSVPSSSTENLTFSTANALLDSQTLSTLNSIPPLPMPPTLDSSNYYHSLLSSKLYPSSSTSNLCNPNDPSASLTSPMTFKTEPPESPKPHPVFSSSSSQGSQPSLARLYIQPGNCSNSIDEQELIENQRPSMTHEYLPVNMNDADLKLEIAYHYQDLNRARELVLRLK